MKILTAWVAMLVLLFGYIPPMHVHAAEEGSTSPVSLITGTAVNCSCNPVTEPQMRALMEEYFSKYLSRETDETVLSGTMVYNIGWGPTLEELKNLKVYADIESSHHLIDWSYYQPKQIDNEWRADSFTGEAVRAFNVLGKKLPIFYNVTFAQNTTKPSMSTIYPSNRTGAQVEPNLTPPPLPDIEPQQTLPQVQELGDEGEEEDPLAPDTTPIDTALASSISTASSQSYDIVNKRSLIIMAIYKAMGIEYYNKPVVYSTLLGDATKPFYRLVDTPFFKQMPAADLKWNQYTVMNARGHSYLFVDNNYLEAYMVRAVNDQVISPSELASSFIQILKTNYFPKGSVEGNVVSSGSCEDYLLINRNGSLGPTITTTYQPNEIGVVYNVTNGNIQYNPAFQAMTSEAGTRLIDFVNYAYQVMYTNGFPVLTKKEEVSLFAALGAKIPDGFSDRETKALCYLIAHGILEPEISAAKLSTSIQTEDLLIYLSRIADEDSRLTFKYDVTPFDVAMAEQGYVKTEVVDEAVADLPKEMEVSYQEGAATYYDYYIPKKRGIATVAPGTENFTELQFSLDAPNISPSWGTFQGEVTYRGDVYYHYRLPTQPPAEFQVEDPSTGHYVMNSQNPLDEPLYVSVPKGGGLYEYAGDLIPGETSRPVLKRNLNADISGNWEGKAVTPTEPMTVNPLEIIPFANTGGTVTLKFSTSNYRNLTVAGISLAQVGVDQPAKEFLGGEYKISVETNPSMTGEHLVTIIAPESAGNVITQLVKFSTNSSDGYPAYINKSTGRALVSEDFLVDKCKLVRSARPEQNYITYYSSTGNGVETTLIKDSNMAISGSTIVSFGDEPCFEIASGTGGGTVFVDIRAFANQLMNVPAFIDSTGVVHIDATPKVQTTSKISLWSDNAVKFTVGMKDNSIIVNTLPSAISSTIILRDLTSSKAEPKIFQARPAVTGPAVDPILKEFFGNTSAFEGLEITELELSLFDYDNETGEITWEPPDKNSYKQFDFYESDIELPIYKDGSEYVIANIPLLKMKGKNDATYASYVSFGSAISARYDYKFDTWKAKADTELKQAITPSSNSIIIDSTEFSLNEATKQLFPVGLLASLHGVGDRKLSFNELHTLMNRTSSTSAAQPAVLYFAGGYYVVHRETTAVNARTPVSFQALKETDGIKQINLNRAAFIHARPNSNCMQTLDSEGNIQLNGNGSFFPLHIAALHTESTGYTSVFISESEMFAVVVSGTESKYFGNESVFGKVFGKANWLFATLNTSEVERNLALKRLDYILLIIYYAVIRIPPRILVASLFIIMALSLVIHTRVVEVFSNRVIDPIRVASFGLVRREEVDRRMIWISATLGIIFLVMIEQGTIDTLYIYLFDQIMEILWRIQRIY